MAGRRREREAPADDERDLGPDADAESVARTIVLTKLTAKARSRQELAEALAARSVPDEVATRVLDRFTEVGLIDDAAFAESWVEGRQQSRGMSKRSLMQELRRKGVDDEVIRASVADLDEAHERSVARGLVDRKLRSTRGLSPDKRLRRLVGMLARKGYPSGVAMAVVREAMHDDDIEVAELAAEMSFELSE
jgi:regulatory protein